MTEAATDEIDPQIEDQQVEPNQTMVVLDYETVWSEHLNIDIYRAGDEFQKSEFTDIFLCLREALNLVKRETRNKDLNEEITITKAQMNNLEKAVARKSTHWPNDMLREMILKLLVVGQEKYDWDYVRLPKIIHRIPRDPGVLLGPHMLALSACQKLCEAFTISLQNVDNLSQE